MTARRPIAALAPVPLLVALLAVLLGAAGCTRVGLAVGAGSMVGTAASSERGLVTTVEDDRIWLAINAAWLDHDPEMFQAVKLQVHEGRVLLSGRVDTPAMRRDAVRLAWQVDGVREVLNEIEVSQAGDFGSFLQDRWISAQLRNRIMFDREIRSINYSIETVGGVVYLMGIAQNAGEEQRVIDHARDIPYVREVVSYVTLKPDPGQQAAAAP